MRATTLLAAMPALHHIAATPVGVPQQAVVVAAAVATSSAAAPSAGKKNDSSSSLAATGATSCPADTLSADTWKKLDLDKFLAAWAKANVTKAQSNNVQALAQSFGAPNFFWYDDTRSYQSFTAADRANGLDNFCNAGQPCLPVELPAWYGLIAIQNWNSYMNSINTAITFASSIISLTLPGIVSDLSISPPDDVTPMKNLYKAMTTIIGLVPFTGPIATGASALTQGVNFIMDQVKPPEPTDQFVAWSNIAGQMGNVVSGYQSQVSAGFKKILDAPVDDANSGILKVIAQGAFLGYSQNVTQADLQKGVIDTFRVYSAGLALRAQGLQLSVANDSNPANGNSCVDSAKQWGAAADCRDDGNGHWRQVVLVDKDGYPQEAIMQKLIDNYGLTKEVALQDNVDCNNADPTTDSLPLDPKTKCLFTLPLQPPAPLF
ncbi:hypothetical protein PG994_008267 [Apiospora phragmitis]|uniref:DUF7872 domain-containing protein n=1 Tax=Apiospora phragmitis TaxID=2905665 RepID=A0ABR1USJ1_9PEZI